MKKIFVLLFGFGLMMQSCGTFYKASYSVGLSSVESPADAKQQFGETKVVNLTDEEGISKYRYEDDYIEISWYVSSTKFNFDLKNKSGHTIKINWDDISYVDVTGQAGRVMHAGVKYAEKNNSQPATTIPKNATISDVLIPTDNIYYISGTYGGWQEKSLIPSYYQSQEAFNQNAEKYIGKKLTILMPIMIENVQNDYTFVFNIDKLLNAK